MNRNDLVAAVVQSTGLKAKDADNTIVKTLFEIMSSISRHEGVALMGFGSFHVRKKAARTGRNPRTGENIEIPAKYSISFRPGKLMKEMANASPSEIYSNLAVVRPATALARKTMHKPNQTA
ncbi:MAG: HU family DNA-binding protein [Deltaproteobacteria bacterium]|jgi:DNA-binding protein HU-beta|nr:HU family DNA-binding protein [Deltaproteobacteria bacterium]